MNVGQLLRTSAREVAAGVPAPGADPDRIRAAARRTARRRATATCAVVASAAVVTALALAHGGAGDGRPVPVPTPIPTLVRVASAPVWGDAAGIHVGERVYPPPADADALVLAPVADGVVYGDTLNRVWLQPPSGQAVEIGRYEQPALAGGASTVAAWMERGGRGPRAGRLRHGEACGAGSVPAPRRWLAPAGAGERRPGGEPRSLRLRRARPGDLHGHARAVVLRRGVGAAPEHGGGPALRGAGGPRAPRSAPWSTRCGTGTPRTTTGGRSPSGSVATDLSRRSSARSRPARSAPTARASRPWSRHGDGRQHVAVVDVGNGRSRSLTDDARLRLLLGWGQGDVLMVLRSPDRRRGRPRAAARLRRGGADLPGDQVRRGPPAAPRGLTGAVSQGRLSRRSGDPEEDPTGWAFPTRRHHRSRA